MSVVAVRARHVIGHGAVGQHHGVRINIDPGWIGLERRLPGHLPHQGHCDHAHHIAFACAYESVAVQLCKRKTSCRVDQRQKVEAPDGQTVQEILLPEPQHCPDKALGRTEIKAFTHIINLFFLLILSNQDIHRYLDKFCCES